MEDNLKAELDQASAIYNMIIEFFVNYSFQIVGAVLILFAGMLIARKIGNLVLSLCEKKGLDITLSRFIGSAAKILIVVMVAIMALGKVGISVTPFLAAVGALSLGAGLAVQGLVSNYGAGLNIILTRPFIVGDTISVQGVSGIVKEVHLAYTILSNEDETEINIPNKHIVGEVIHNSFKNTLAEVSIGIAYHEDADQAITHIKNGLSTLKGICQEKVPQVGIESFEDSAVQLGVRVWLPTEHYFSLLHQVNATIYKALKENNVDIPFPQRQVTLLKED